MSVRQKASDIVLSIISTKFIKNFSFLFFGSAASQIIAFLSLPFLTYLYNASAFGQLELFLSIGALVAALANFRLEYIIGLVHEHKEANNVLILCLLSNIIFFFLTLIVCFVSFKIFQIEKIFLLLPVYIFISAFSESLKYYQLRQENYSNVAYFRTLKVALIVASCFLMVGLGFSCYGLIFGNILGEILASILLVKVSKNFSFYDFSFNIIKQIYAQHKVLTKTLFSSQIIGIIAVRIPSLFISVLGSKEELGYYSICRQILAAPTMIAENIGSIYRQEAIRENRKFGKFNDCFSLYFIIISSFAAAIFSFLFFCADIIISIVAKKFSDGVEAYFYVLLISTFFAFISTPLDKSAQIVGAHKYILFWHISRVFIMISGSIICYGLESSVFAYLVFLTICNSLFYAYDIGYEYYLSFENKKRTLDRNVSGNVCSNTVV
ncbi:MAG: oligosaccharide flippase family protein [Alphaproteobacteria bacterium]|nr:oligosaccharide flippase family protein [Alphaproteobacteria bacterium]